MKPDPVILEFIGQVACLSALADAIRAKLNPNPVDVSVVMEDIGKLLDASITGATMPATPGVMLDLSKIDFEALAKRFKSSKTKNTDLEVLKNAGRGTMKLSEFKKLVDHYKENSIPVNTDLLIGLPGETAETLRSCSKSWLS